MSRFSHRLVAVTAASLWFIGPLSGPAKGAVVLIEVFRSSFLPEAVEIELGDTVRWQWIAGEHTVTSGRPDGAAGTPDEPGRLFDVALVAETPTFEYTFTEPREEGYFFFDRRAPDRLGVIQIASGEKVFRVAVVDNVFNPDVLHIFAGDSVKWEHEPNEGFHTVTSGRSSRPEDTPGALFDEESSDARPIFVYRFATPGEYPYFCRPHEFLGMTGVVIVEAPFVRGDATGEGTVDISDPIAVLGTLFLGRPAPPCADAMDANDDGQVTISDPTAALNFLFLGGPPLPAPFPHAGADRTEDSLRCSPPPLDFR